jgi:hypothetical protein
MGMKNVFKLFQGFRKNDVPDAVAASSPSGQNTLRMPELTLAPDVAFIAAKGESAYKGDVQHAQAERDVEQHHQSLATTFLEKISDEPKGWQQAKTKELDHVRDDLVRVDREIKNINKRVETDIASDKPRTMAELVKLIVTGVASIALSLWSIYAMHAFLDGTGILSGWPAWGVSVGPIMFAFAAKEAIVIIDGDRQKRMAKLTYIAITIISAIVWTATFGHEAGSPMNQLNDLNSGGVVNTGSGAYFVVRGIAQMIIELFGGGILFHTFFALWEKKADGQVITKTVQESPQFLAAEEERRILRVRENELENHLAQIAKWFDSHDSFRAQYVTRAKGQFTHIINLLQGA